MIWADAICDGLEYVFTIGQFWRIAPCHNITCAHAWFFVESKYTIHLNCKALSHTNHLIQVDGETLR